ncbi:MAG: type II toxin-antitoxin system VapC family toxin [Desulfobacterales bacterium]
MKLAIDSSSFAKRYVQEVGSDKLDHLLQDSSELGFCIILVPEIVSAMNRRQREGVLTIKEYRTIKNQLIDDVRDATVLQITPSVVSRSIKLLENNLLRTLDALHVACALEWQADLFVTSDRRQFTAAVKTGLQTEYVGQPATAADG